MTTTFLSVIAIVLSALSLGWQALSWWWEGLPRITGLIESEQLGRPWEVSVTEQRPVQMSVIVINVGRSPATIISDPMVDVRVSDGDWLIARVPVTFRLAGDNPSTPCRLEEGATLRWRYDVVATPDGRRKEAPSYEVRARVKTPRRTVTLTGFLHNYWYSWYD